MGFQASFSFSQPPSKPGNGGRWTSFRTISSVICKTQVDLDLLSSHDPCNSFPKHLDMSNAVKSYPCRKRKVIVYSWQFSLQVRVGSSSVDSLTRLNSRWLFILFGPTKTRFRSYVRNCIIRASQNRGIVLRGVQELTLENNILHGVKGSGFMLVDGTEIGNVLRNNLVIRLRISRFLHSADLEPAAFWLSNPANTVQGNVAAGGTHSGFR